jgi:hypothetical protein
MQARGGAAPAAPPGRPIVMMIHRPHGGDGGFLVRGQLRANMTSGSSGSVHGVDATDCEWLGAQLLALYHHDHRGRITTWRMPGHPAAPRFHLGRTRHGNAWRLRADVAPPLARRLSRLVAREPPLPQDAPPWPLPERAEAIRRTLDEQGVVVHVFEGIVFRAPYTIVRSPALAYRAEASERLPAEDRARLDELAAVLPGIAATARPRAPLVVSREEGRIASVAYTRAGDAHTAAEVGLETVVPLRGRGHDARAVAGWILAVRDAGGTPLLGAAVDDVGALGLARSLGLEAFAHTLHWT